MKKISLLLCVLVALLAVSCKDMLLQKDTNAFSISFKTPGDSSSRAGTTANWKVRAWLELEDTTVLQEQKSTVPAGTPTTITFAEVPIGTRLQVCVELEDSENSFIKYKGSSGFLEVNAQEVPIHLSPASVEIDAGAPTITTQPENQTKSYQAGDEVDWTVNLTAAATSPDGGALSYQWYESSTNSNTGGTLIPEATRERYSVVLTPGTTRYFYCVVTNTNDAAVNGNKAVSSTSAVAEIKYEIGVYGQVSGVLMWKHDTENSSNSYKIVPYGAYNNAGVSLSTSSSSLVWCFDNAGNIYWYADGENGAQRYDIQADGTYRSSEIYYYAPPFSALSYDNVTDILYGIGDGGSLKYWQKTGGASSDIYGDDGGMVSVPEPLGFAVHNNVVYVANFSQIEEEVDGMMSKVAKVTVSKYDVSDVTSSPTTNEIKLPENFVSSTFSVPTGQMIYQDGALYLLLRRIEINDASNASADVPVEHYSLGALAKIDPNTLTLDTSFGDGGYLGLSSSSDTFNNRKESGDNTFNVTYHGSAADNNTFYGPVGFVAVMPKKLVIGDAGFAMSENGDDKVGLTKKSRVVTVDLETMVFDVTDVGTEYYQDEIYGSFSNQGYSYIVINQ